jgi:hypothetical protein
MGATQSTCPELAREIIGALRADGIEPTLDQIAELIHLARKVQEPSRRTSPWYEGDPVRAGESGPTLRPLTIQAEEWFDWAVSEFTDDKWRGLAFCYAAQNGRAPGAFDDLWDSKKARAALRSYARRLPCNRVELESAAMRIMDAASPGDTYRARKADEGESGYDYGDLLARLVAATGHTREYWLGQSRTYAFRVLEHAMNIAHAAWGAGGQGHDPDYLRASFDLQAAEMLIREGAKNGE